MSSFFKKILLGITFLTLAVISNAQVYQTNSNYGIQFKRVKIDSAMTLPRQSDTAFVSNIDSIGSIIYIDGTGSVPKGTYVYDGRWNKIINEENIPLNHEYNINGLQYITDRNSPVIPFRIGENYIEYNPTPIMFPDSTTYVLTKGSNTNYLALSIRPTTLDTFAQWGTGVSQGGGGDWDNGTVWDGLMVYDSTGADTVRCFYTGISSGGDAQIGYAYAAASAMPTTLTKYASNPTISKAQVEAFVGYTTSFIACSDLEKRNDTLILYISVGDLAGAYKVYYAISTDWVNWTMAGLFIEPPTGFDLAAYSSTIKLDDDVFYTLYDVRKSSILSGKIRGGYSKSLTEPLKDLSGDFLSVKPDDFLTTTYTGRIYAGKWLKHWYDWSQPVEVRGNWEYYYSASDEGSPRADRAFLAKIPPYEYRTNPDTVKTIVVHNGNTLGQELTIGTSDNYPLNLEINNVTRWSINTDGRLRQNGLAQDYGYDIQALKWISVGDLYAFTNTQQNVRIGDVYSGNPNSTAALRLVAIGNGSLRYATTNGNDNTSIGYLSSNLLTTGRDNTRVGSQAGRDNATGSYNTNIGMYTYLSGGNYTTSTGYQAGFLASGDLNTLYGYQSGDALTTGSSNVFVGPQVGHGITTGSNNIFIGTSTAYGESNTSNKLKIGNGTTGPYPIEGDLSTKAISLANTLTIGSIPNGAGTDSLLVSDGGVVKKVESTVTSESTSRSTSDASTQNEDFTITDGVYTVIVEAASSNDRKTWVKTFAIKNIGGTATILGAITDVLAGVGDVGLSTASISVTVNSGSVRVGLTGIAATSINWRVKLIKKL